MSITISEPLALQTKHWQVMDFKALKGTIKMIVHTALSRDTEIPAFKVHLIHAPQQETP